ncbi:MAG: VOC family protein, partial [Bacteroidota bacterium]
FSWKIEPKGSSANIDTGRPETITGHLNQLGPDDPQNYLTVYIETDSIEADLALIEANGGEKLIGPLPLADGSLFAWFKDNAGNTVGLLSPGS